MAVRWDNGNAIANHASGKDRLIHITDRDHMP